MEDYSPGLEGIVAGESAISKIDPDEGLLYRGYDIQELALESSFEETAWLLLHGELPNMEELGKFEHELAAARDLPPHLLDALELLPSSTHPMDLLRTGVSMLGAFDPDLEDLSAEANLRKAIRIIGGCATIVGDGWQILRGEVPVGNAPVNLTHAGSLLHKLKGTYPEQWETEIFDTALITYAENEFNASAFAARVTASTLSDIYSAVVTATGTLKGRLHGGANEAVLSMIEEIGSVERVEPWVRLRLATKEKIMGFGHRVFKTGDARVPVMRELARRLSERQGGCELLEVCEALQDVMERERQICANVDLYAAVVFSLMGIPAELSTAVFASARVAGWCAHVIEQQGHNRLIRPSSRYVGHARRQYSSPIGAGAR